MRNVGPNDVGGGALAAIQGTLIQAAIATAIAVPIGVLGGVYLVEYRDKRLVKPLSFMTDVLTGIPSIVSGLFIYALLITTFGFNRMGLLVSLALTLLMIPVIVRGTEEMLRSCPPNCARPVMPWGPALAHDHEGRVAHGDERHHHHRDAGRGPHHGRDRATAHPGRLYGLDQQQPVRRRAGGPCL